MNSTFSSPDLMETGDTLCLPSGLAPYFWYLLGFQAVLGTLSFLFIIFGLVTLLLSSSEGRSAGASSERKLPKPKVAILGPVDSLNAFVTFLERRTDLFSFFDVVPHTNKLSSYLKPADMVWYCCNDQAGANKAMFMSRRYSKYYKVTSRKTLILLGQKNLQTPSLKPYYWDEQLGTRPFDDWVLLNEETNDPLDFPLAFLVERWRKPEE